MAGIGIEGGGMLVWRELCSEADNSERPPAWILYLVGGRKPVFVSRP